VFESSAIANLGTREGRRWTAALVSVAALALVAAGCGGDGDSGGRSEAAARKKLEAGAAKLTDAKSFRVQVPIEAETDGETEEVACLNLALDNHTKPERVDLLFFGQSCLGGAEAHELIAIGREAWATSGQGSWTAATITPFALDEIDQEQTDLKGLFAAAENIDTDAEGGAVEEGEGNYVDVPRYTFEAPASAFPGTDEELGDVQIEFEAVLDRKGFLRELVVHGEEDGTGATVTDKYEDVNQDLDIAPPDPSEVKGPKAAIRSEADLDRLFGGSSGSP
jgi:hypothetical protein